MTAVSSIAVDDDRTVYVLDGQAQEIPGRLAAEQGQSLAKEAVEERRRDPD